MKKYLLALLLFPWSFCWADTTTPYLGLTLPTTSTADNWGRKLNTNFSVIDTTIGVISTQLSGTSSFNVLKASQVFISTPTYPGTDKLAVNGQSTFFGATGANLRLCDSNASNCQSMTVSQSNPQTGINVSTLTLTKGLYLSSTTDSTTGVVFNNNLRWLHNYSGNGAAGQNIFIGQGAGNFTMGDGTNSGGSWNTTVGNGALAILTTGYANTAIGYASMFSLTYGHDNSGFGYNSLNLITTGTFNSSLGSQALGANSSGHDNSAVGYRALAGVNSGNYNTALGSQAGYSVDGSSATTTGTYNTFIGYGAVPQGTVSQLTNATAIGANSVVSSSNTIQLGGTNTNTVLAGYLQFFPKTAAQILALTPSAVGQSYYCSNCVLDTLCISTGTGIGAFVRVSSRTVACQ